MGHPHGPDDTAQRKLPNMVGPLSDVRCGGMRGAVGSLLPPGGGCTMCWELSRWQVDADSFCG